MAEKKVSIHGCVRQCHDTVIQVIAGLFIELHVVNFEKYERIGAGVTDAKGEFELIIPEKIVKKFPMVRSNISLVIRDKKKNIVYSKKMEMQFVPGRREYLFINLSSRTMGEPVYDYYTIGALEVNARLFNKLEIQDFVELYHSLYTQKLDKRRVSLFEQINPVLVQHLLTKKEKGIHHHSLYQITFFIHAALEHFHAPTHIMDLINEPVPPLECDLDKEYKTAHFEIFYSTKNGCNDAVNPSDSPSEKICLLDARGDLIGETEDGSGIPTYIQKLAIWLEYAYDKYTQFPYNMRDPAANSERIFVEVRRLTNENAFGFGGGHSIYIDNQLDDITLPSTAVHELFHCVQTHYLPFHDPKNNLCSNPYITEGTTRVIEDSINDLNRWIGLGNTYLSNPNKMGLPDSSNHAVLFWKYMSEQLTMLTSSDIAETERGVDVIRNTWEVAECLKEACSINIPINLRIKYPPVWGSFSEFRYIPYENTPYVSSELQSNETTFGNWLAANYLQELRDLTMDPRYIYLEECESYETNEEHWTLQPVGHNECSLGPDESVDYVGNWWTVKSWAATYFECNIRDGVDTVRVKFTKVDDFIPLVQLLLMKQDGSLGDIIKFDKPFEKTINAKEFKKVIIVIGATWKGGEYSLHLESYPPTSDVMVTRWNSDMGKEYEIDPKRYAWTWISPDIWVDNRDANQAPYLIDPSVRFEWDNPKGGSNHVYIRLRNKGTKTAEKINVSFYYQPASATLQGDAWVPMTENKEGGPARLTGQRLEPGEEKKWYVNWWLPYPHESGVFHFSVKAEVESSTDVNTDNKIALSNCSSIAIAHIQNGMHIVPYLELCMTFADYDRDLAGPMLINPDELRRWYWLPWWFNGTQNFETVMISYNDPPVFVNRQDFQSLERIFIGELPINVRENSAKILFGEKNFNSFLRDRQIIPKRCPERISRRYRLRFIQKDAMKRSGHSFSKYIPLDSVEPKRNKYFEKLPLKPESLPPGIEKIHLITLVQMCGGQVIGGVTYAIPQNFNLQIKQNI